MQDVFKLDDLSIKRLKNSNLSICQSFSNFYVHMLGLTLFVKLRVKTPYPGRIVKNES